MIVDSSALVALLFREPGWERIANALTAHAYVAIGAPTLAETAIVLPAKGAASSLLPALLRRAGIAVLAFTDHHATFAADAYVTSGRGYHPASQGRAWS